jgi:hypothetical protein
LSSEAKEKDLSETADYAVVSEDSHVGPPLDLGTESPHENTGTLNVEENERGRFFVALGIQLSSVLLGFAAGRSSKEFRERLQGMAALRPLGPAAEIR